MNAAGGGTGNGPWWVRASAVLGASGVGRACGLSPQLAADVAMLGTGGEGRRVPLRVVVARTGEGPGPVPLLTGLRIADPPFVTDLLPVAVVHGGVDRPELRLSPCQAAALDRLARLLTDRRQAQLPQEVLSAAPRTAAWLRVRAPEVARGSFFSTGCAGTDEVARTLRRCQDLTAAAPASSALDAAVASVLSAPAVIRAHFRASPLPWAAPTSGASNVKRPPLRESAADAVARAPADRDHLYPEVVDLPVVPPDRTGTESGRALRREALELLHAAHLVLAVVPAAELGGDVAPSPAIAALGGLLERVRGATHPPAVVLVATVAAPLGATAMADLGSWLRSHGRRTVGPAADGVPVFPLALSQAGRAVWLLDSAARRPEYAVRQAEADCAASGLAALCDLVLRPLIDQAPMKVPELTVQRLRAACRDTRLAGHDLMARHEWAAATTPRSATGEPPRDTEVPSHHELFGEGDARRLWDRLEALTASALAERAVRQLATKGVQPRGH
ncbi:hypothetical protein [Streptomyces sp. NPDC055287]